MELKTLISYILPSWVEDHFEVVGIRSVAGKLEISLDELNHPPSRDSYESKGFLPEVHLEDFPLRGKPVVLRVRRRKWKNLTTGKNETTNWKLAVQGTSYTEDFALFLKRALGQLPS